MTICLSSSLEIHFHVVTADPSTAPGSRKLPLKAERGQTATKVEVGMRHGKDAIDRMCYRQT